jgi:NAD(P)H-nitrite reductase large subunit
MYKYHMIVCVCANKNRDEVEAAIKNGCDTFDDLAIEHEVCANCGMCYPVVAELLAVNTVEA